MGIPMLIVEIYYLNLKSFESMTYHPSLRNWGAEYVGNKMPRQIQNFPVCVDNALAKKTAKDLAEIFVYHVSNGFSISQHFATDYDLVF